MSSGGCRRRDRRARVLGGLGWVLSDLSSSQRPLSPLDEIRFALQNRRWLGDGDADEEAADR